MIAFAHVSVLMRGTLRRSAVLLALATANGLSFSVFRYFNAAGASEDGVIGEDHHPRGHCLGDVRHARRPWQP